MLLFAVPLYTTRLAYQRFVEVREMFTETVGSLAEAVDKRDTFTSGHSHRVQEIAMDIGRAMKVSDDELEALEWGGLLHDIGKIGVPDAVLLKQERLTPDERTIMNAHPVLGAEIIAPVTPAGPGAADHPPPPRVVQRIGLSGPARRRRDPQAGADPARRRRVRGDDRRPAVPHDPADARAGAGRAAQVRRHPVRPGRRRRLRPDEWARGLADPGRREVRDVPLIGQAAGSRWPGIAQRRFDRRRGGTARVGPPRSSLPPDCARIRRLPGASARPDRGGGLENSHVRLRWLPVLLVGRGARFGLDAALSAGGDAGWLRLWLVLAAYVLLTAMLLANRSLPGLTAAALGTAANGIAIVANGGWMPVWQPSLAAAGFDPNNVHSNFHRLLAGPVDAGFFAHGGPLVDIIPIPIPMLQSVASVGDVLLGAGLAFFVFAAVVRAPVLVSVSVPARSAASRPRRAARIRTSGSPPTAPSRPCGSARSSARSGDRVHQVALVFLVARATNARPWRSASSSPP